MKAAVKLVDDEAGAFDRGPQQHWRAKPVAERGAIPSWYRVRLPRPVLPQCP